MIDSVEWNKISSKGSKALAKNVKKVKCDQLWNSKGKKARISRCPRILLRDVRQILRKRSDN